jgi:glutathione S-transferase
MNNTALKLYYFNLQARAELIRLIFAAAGRSWNDVRFEYSEWPVYKAKLVLGQCPVLELPDGTQIPQSMSIARYVARESGLAGKDNLESAKIDAVVDTQRDMNELFHTRVLFEKNAEKKNEQLNKFLVNDLFKYVDKLTQLKNVFSHDRRYFVGNQLSWADIFVYTSIERVIRTAPHVKSNIDLHLKDVFDTIHGNSKIKKYLDERPRTPF